MDTPIDGDQQNEISPRDSSVPVEPYAPPTHTYRIVFALTLLIGGILLGFAFFIAKSNHFPLLGLQPPVPTGEPKHIIASALPVGKPSNISEWKTLSNSSCNITVSYPPDWGIVLNNEDQTPCSVILTHATGQAASRFILTGYKNKNGWDSIKSSLHATTPTSFAGLEAYSFVEPQPTGFNGNQKMKSILARSGEMVYLVSLLFFKTDPGMDQVLYQIAGTVKVGSQ